MCKERPILFSTEMVRAILEGRKTQTRRVISPQPYVDKNGNWCSGNRNYGQSLGGWPDWRHLANCLCRFGKPGDVLYVKEAHRIVGWDWEFPEVLVEYKDGIMLHKVYDLSGDGHDKLVNYTDKLVKEGIYAHDPEDEERLKPTGKPHPWKPSIFMPYHFARLFLDVLDVRVERLQGITQADAISEGVLSVSGLGETEEYDKLRDEAIASGSKPPLGPSPVERFKALWISINGQESWDSNPWVWVIIFKQSKNK